MIDSHVHLYPPDVNRDPAGWAAAHREPHWSALCLRRRRDGRPVQAFPDTGGLLRAMDAAGVGRAVLLGWYWETPASCLAQNRFYAACVRSHPDRLAAAATLHPSAGREAALAELRRARDDGLRGIGELSPHAQGYAVDDPVFRSILAEAGIRGLPVTLHATDPDSRPYPGRVLTPLEDFLRLAREFPATTFILAHWGGLLPLRIPEAATLRNIYFDTSASPLNYDDGIWRRFLGSVPAGRVVFGSDFPLNLYPRQDDAPSMIRLIAEVRGAGLSAGALEAVLQENARRLFF